MSLQEWPRYLPRPLSLPPKLPLAMFLLKQLCGGSYTERDLRLEEESASCLEEESGGGSRRIGPTGTITLEVKWNQRQFSFVGLAPSLEKGVAPLWLEVLLRWLDTFSFWKERKEGGKAGGDIERHAW